MSEATKQFSETWVEEAALAGKSVEADEPVHETPGAGVDLRESIDRLEYYADDSGSSVRLGRVHMRDGTVHEVPKKFKRALLSESGELAGAFDTYDQVACVAAVTGLPVESLRPFLEAQDRVAVENLEAAMAERADDAAEEAEIEALDKARDAEIEAIAAERDRKVGEALAALHESHARAIESHAKNTAQAFDGWREAARALDDLRARLADPRYQNLAESGRCWDCAQPWDEHPGDHSYVHVLDALAEGRPFPE